MAIAKFLLFVFVVFLGLTMGSGLYEGVAVLPMFLLGPPESVTAYYQHNMAYPQFTVNAGPLLWRYLTPLTALFSLAALISGLFFTGGTHRKLRTFGAALFIITFIVTIGWFIPNLIRMLTDAPNMTAEEITTTATWWYRLNWVRFGLLGIAWLATLKAMTLPAEKR